MSEGISISDEEWTEEDEEEKPSTEGYPEPITPTPPDTPAQPQIDPAEQSERV